MISRIYKKKALEPLIATILLVVVAVILVTIVLTWGKTFTTDSLNKTTTFTEADSSIYMFSFQKLQNGKLIFKNISPTNKEITIIGYKINSPFNHELLNKINYLPEPQVMSPGATAVIGIVTPPETVFDVELYTEDQKYITISGVKESQPSLNFTKIFGEEGWNDIKDITQTSDGGYLILGVTTAFGAGSLDIWLIKTDSSGNLDWNKTFGGSSSEEPKQVLETSDGSYLIIGNTNSFGAGSLDIWLIKTDSSGNVCDYSSNGNCTDASTFAKTIGGNAEESPAQILETSDGGYLILGDTRSYELGAPNINFFLIKINSSGNICDYSSNGNCTGIDTFVKTIGGSESDSSIQVLEASDGSYLIIGSTYSFGAGSWDIWLIKTDSSGNVCDYSSNGNCTDASTFAKTIGGNAEEYPVQILETSDGEYLILGPTQSYGAGSTDIWLLKIDASGNEILDKTFGGSSSEESKQVLETSDGSYLILGNTRSYDEGSYHSWVIKTDSSGNVCDYSSNGNCTDASTFAKTIGRSNYIAPQHILETSNNTYIVLNKIVDNATDIGESALYELNNFGEITNEIIFTIGGYSGGYIQLKQLTTGDLLIGYNNNAYGVSGGCDYRFVFIKIPNNINLNSYNTIQNNLDNFQKQEDRGAC